MANVTATDLAALQQAQADVDLAYLADTADERHRARAAGEQWTWALARWVDNPLNVHAEDELDACRAEFDKADADLRKALTAAKGKRTKALAAAGIGK